MPELGDAIKIDASRTGHVRAMYVPRTGDVRATYGPCTGHVRVIFIIILSLFYHSIIAYKVNMNIGAKILMEK